jgi:hypothetical protein
MESTKAILFQGRGFSLIHRLVLYLNNKEITYLSNLKLSWATHAPYLCQKLDKVLYLITFWGRVSDSNIVIKIRQKRSKACLRS